MEGKLIYRYAQPADGPEMLRLIESHPVGGGVQILYTRRPDAYKSYFTECPEAEIIVCEDDSGCILAQAVGFPRRLYIDGEAQTLGYVTGLHKKDGALINTMKMLDTGRFRSPVKQFFCSFLDDNKAAYELFARRGIVQPLCDYTTYCINPAALKSKAGPARNNNAFQGTTGHGFEFRRADSGDSEKLIDFYNEEGSAYSFFPAFSSMEDFTGLTVSDFFLLKYRGDIVVAGALWDQRGFKQCIVTGYGGIYKPAAFCNPLLRLLHYPPLPKRDTTANFAYISFLLCRKAGHTTKFFEGAHRRACPDPARIFLGEIAAAAKAYDFLTIGAVKGSQTGELLDSVRGVKTGSKLCLIDYEKSSPPSYDMPLWFECGLL